MTRILDISNSSNWEEIYQQSFSAVIVTPRLHEPIPEINIPLLIDTAILGVRVTTDIPEGSEWDSAGYIRQNYQLGLIVGGQPDAGSISSRHLALGFPNLIVFQRLATTYSISIKLPAWFKNAQVTIWKYSGIDSDSVEQKVDILTEKLNSLIELIGG